MTLCRLSCVDTLSTSSCVVLLLPAAVHGGKEKEVAWHVTVAGVSMIATTVVGIGRLRSSNGGGNNFGSTFFRHEETAVMVHCGTGSTTTGGRLALDETEA